MGVVRVTWAISTCGLRKFRHSKSSVYRWYPQLVSGRFVYDTSRHGWMHMFITHSPTVTLQLHNFDLFRTCRTCSFCTVAWQLARFQLIRRIARSLGDNWASCLRSVSSSTWLCFHCSLTYPFITPSSREHCRQWSQWKHTTTAMTLTYRLDFQSSASCGRDPYTRINPGW